MTTYFPYESKNFRTPLDMRSRQAIETASEAEADYEPNDDGKPLPTWPVVQEEQSNTGRPIDNIINNPVFMIQASTGMPYTPRSETQRIRDEGRVGELKKKQDRNLSRQRLRISVIQSRGDADFYYGSSANDNTPLQKATAA